MWCLSITTNQSSIDGCVIIYNKINNLKYNRLKKIDPSKNINALRKEKIFDLLEFLIVGKK